MSATAPVPEALLQLYAGIGEAYARIDCQRALAGVRELVRAAQDGSSPVLSVCRDLAILLTPVLPQLGQEMETLLGADRPWSWNDLGRPFAGRPAGSTGVLEERLRCRGMARLLVGEEE